MTASACRIDPVCIMQHVRSCITYCTLIIVHAVIIISFSSSCSLFVYPSALCQCNLSFILLLFILALAQSIRCLQSVFMTHLLIVKQLRLPIEGFLFSANDQCPSSDVYLLRDMASFFQWKKYFAILSLGCL